MRLDETGRANCVKEAEVSSLLQFMRIGGKFWLYLRKMTAYLALFERHPASQ